MGVESRAWNFRKIPPTESEIQKKIYNPHILWNPEFHYPIYKSPPPLPVLSQTSPCPIPLQLIFYYYFPSMPRSSKWSLLLKSPHQKPVCTSPFSHTRYMPRASHSSWFYHPNNIRWGVQIISPSISSLLDSPVTSSLSGPKISSSASYSRSSST